MILDPGEMQDFFTSSDRVLLTSALLSAGLTMLRLAQLACLIVFVGSNRRNRDLFKNQANKYTRI